MADDLQGELRALEARSQELGEAGSPPRGALPGLFRALRAAPREAAAAALPALAARLADWPLVEPTLLLVRERDLAGEWHAALTTAAPRPADKAARGWCALAQVGALLRAGPAPAQLLALLELLLAEAPGDPTPLALELGVEPLCAALLEALRVRLGAPADRRDRTSSRLARGAIAAAARALPDALELQRLVAQLVVAETRRAGDAEPVLALEALDALALAPPATRVRLLVPLLRALAPLKRRRPLERAEALLGGALQGMGAGPSELAELTARTGGLEPDGVARVRLEGDEDARLSLDAAGQVVVALPAQAGPGERRAVESAQDELRGARRELARRLEVAMVAGRTWRLAPWRAVFLEHPLWRDLATRVVWRAGTVSFELDPGDLTPRDLFGDPLPLEEGRELSLPHPLELAPDELDLWRERAWARGRAAPFAQLFRPVLAVGLARSPGSAGASAPEPGGAALERFRGREAHRRELEELARRSGWLGLPLAGNPPWTVRRELPGLRAELELGDVPAPPPKTLGLRPRRPARKKDEDDDDDDEAPRARARPEKERRPPPEAAPRVRITAAKVSGDLAGPRAAIALAELVRDLEELTDALACPDDLWLREWQENRYRDPEGAWKTVVLRYRLGSPATVAVRRALLAELLRREGLAGRLEDRFLIAGRFVLELGTGLVHEGPQKDHLHAWRAEEEARHGHAGRPALALPFEPEADPETARIVALALGLARRGAAPPG